MKTDIFYNEFKELFWDHSAEKFRKLDVVANLHALLSPCSNVEILFSPSTNDLSLGDGLHNNQKFKIIE